MTNILPFKRPKASEKHSGKTLCRHGFHKWAASKETRFDVKQGKLLTLLRCTRCKAEKLSLT